MEPMQRFLIMQEISALLVDYWHEVDRNWGEAAHEYYTEDAIFTTSLRTRSGRAEIQEFYRSRRDRGARVALHLISNLRVNVHNTADASAEWVLSLHAADGEPILPSKPAIMIADVADVLVRCGDGRWRYRSRVIRPLFRDDTPTTG